MKFERGTRVEILIKKKVPLGVWRSAEIVADNMDGYMVRYYRRPGGPEVVERLPVEAVRPCPPPTSPVIWSVGDIVEVFDDLCWKAAFIQEHMGEDCYCIHVLGSIDEFRVLKTQIRMRQEWKDNKWFRSGEDSMICDDIFYKMLKKSLRQGERDVTIAQQALGTVSLSRTLKRPFPERSCPEEAFAESFSKRKAVEVDPGDSYSFVGKVENYAYQRVNGDRNDEQNSNKKLTLQTNSNSRNHVTEFLARTLEPDNSVSIMSSVASCSTVYDAINDRLQSHSSSGCSQDSEFLCDAESFQPLGVEEKLAASHSKEKPLRTHEVDLSTYRCVLEALYASGPLSWEQEAVLTNLRIKLYVSNDEHLMELRRLKSNGNLSVCC